MLMICWFYCMPFAHLLFYAAAPIMLVFAAFMLRRGVLRARRGLRLAAFVVMFVAAIKIWIFDLRALHRKSGRARVCPSRHHGAGDGMTRAGPATALTMKFADVPF